MAHIPVNQTGQPSFKAQARLRTEGELSSAQDGVRGGCGGAGGQMGSTACPHPGGPGPACSEWVPVFFIFDNVFRED